MVKRYFFIAFLLGISSNISASIDWSSPSTCNIEDSKNLDEIIGQMTLRQKIGQIIMVRENEYFPCDMLLLNTSLPKGICYVETKNLDGETNLKHKQAEKKILQLSKNREEILANFNNATIESELPNASIYTF